MATYIQIGNDTTYTAPEAAPPVGYDSFLEVNTVAPSDGGTTSMADSDKFLIYEFLSTGGVIAAHTLTLPVNGLYLQKVTIMNSGSGAITALTLTAAAAIIGAISTIAIGGFASYFFDGASWVRCG